MTTQQLATSIEQLFSSLRPNVHDFDSSKSFISLSTNGTNDDDDIIASNLTSQQIDRERLRILQFTLQLLHTHPSGFYFYAEKKEAKHIGWRITSTLLHFGESSLRKLQSYEQQNDIVSMKRHPNLLTGVVCQVLAKVLIANFAVQNSKEFTALCRKCIRLYAQYVTFWNNQKNATNNVAVNVALVELLGTMGHHNISLVAEDAQLVESGAQYGLVSLKNNSEANMLLSGSIFALVCMFDKDPVAKHKSIVKTIVASLGTLVDECFKFVAPEHDPRTSILTNINTTTTTTTTAGSFVGKKQASASPSLINSLLKRKNPISAFQFTKLFRSLSNCLQRCLTVPYPFVVELNLRRVMSFLKNAFVLDSSLKVQDSINIKKIIALPSFFEVIPCIHRDALKTLSAIILSAKGALLPHVNSICLILLQEFKQWSSMEEMPLQSLEVYREVVRCIAFTVDAFGPCISEILPQKILPHLQKMILHFYSDRMKVEMDRDVNKDSALQQLQQHFNVTNKKNKNKRRRAENSETEISDNISLPAILKHQYLTLKLLQHILSCCQINASLETLSTIVDIESCLTSSITLFHNHRFVIFQNVSSQTLNKLFTNIVTEQYRTLHQCLISSSAINTQSPFLPHAVALFRKGIQSCIPEIALVCSESLQVIDCFLHPRSAPLHIPSAESVSIQMERMIQREKVVGAMLSEFELPAVQKKSSKVKEIVSDSSDDESSISATAPVVIRQKSAPKQPASVTPKEKNNNEKETTTTTTTAPPAQTKAKQAPQLIPPKVSDESSDEEDEEPIPSSSAPIDFSKANNQDIEKAFEKNIIDSDDEEEEENDDNMDDVDLVDGDDDENMDISDLRLDFSGF